MNGSIRLGRIAGVRVSADWSLVVLCILLVWTLESGIFPRTNPHLSHRTHVWMAIAATAGAVLGVFLHEVGHVVQARRDGMRVEGITLAFYGGVARFTSAFPSGAAEMRVAFAGPFVSLLLGGLAVLVAHADVGEAVHAVAAWLGYINISLGVFNLLPAVPLDGGRLLHGLVWRWKGESAASRVAANVGRFIAYAFITAGLALFMAVRDAYSGAWLVFIGWFLLTGATNESQSEATRHALAGHVVRDLMTRDPITVAPTLTIARFVDEVAEWQRHSTYPVVDDDTVVGLVPLSRAFSVPRSRWDDETVRECMLDGDEVPVVAPDDAALDALPAVAGSDAGHAVVLADGQLVGIIAASDFYRVLAAAQAR